MSNRYNIILLTDKTSVLYLSKTIGAYKIACELRRAGFDVKVIDHLHVFSVEEIKAILKKLINKKTLFVGFSTFFYENCGNVVKIKNELFDNSGIHFSAKELGSMLPHGIKYNQEIIDVIKESNPNCKTVLGGPDAQDLEYAKWYDYVVLGYGDLAVVNLALHLAHGEKLLKSRRSVWKTIIIDDAKADGYDFTATPMKYHNDDIILFGETLPIEIARGCIFKCKFCGYPLNGKSKLDYIKHSSVLYQEFLENYQQFGVTRYIFVDDTFNDSVEKVQMIHDISKKLPFKLEFWAYIRLDLLAARPETIELLFDSGCCAAFFGIETFDETSAKVVGKGGSRKKLLSTIKHIKETYGDQVTLHGSFIFGLPHESMDSMNLTVKQLVNNETGLDSWFIFPLTIQDHKSVFGSVFDLEYEKYNYKKQGTINNFFVDWKNEHTDLMTVIALINKTIQENTPNRKLDGLDMFAISNLGLGLEYGRHKLIGDFNWHNVDLAKRSRAKEYKTKLFDALDLNFKISLPYLGEKQND
jgi:radical SAM superfamily enzyme YgiQ (UPF0313 family)